MVVLADYGKGLGLWWLHPYRGRESAFSRSLRGRVQKDALRGTVLRDGDATETELIDDRFQLCFLTELSFQASLTKKGRGGL